jgi:hypothetical protein
MKRFSVYQSCMPNFGLDAITDGGVFQLVARGQIDGLDVSICERAFEATNSIDEPWFAVAGERYGLTDVVQARSTSVGDVVKIEDETGARYFICDMVGWRLLDKPIATA